MHCMDGLYPWCAPPSLLSPLSLTSPSPFPLHSDAACEEAYFKMNNVLIDDRRIKVDFSQSVHHLWKQFKKWVGGFRSSAESGAEAVRLSSLPVVIAASIRNVAQARCCFLHLCPAFLLSSVQGRPQGWQRLDGG